MTIPAVSLSHEVGSLADEGLEGLVSLEPQKVRLRQFKATVAYFVGQAEVATNPATLGRMGIQSVSSYGNALMPL